MDAEQDSQPLLSQVGWFASMLDASSGYLWLGPLSCYAGPLVGAQAPAAPLVENLVVRASIWVDSWPSSCASQQTLFLK